MKSFRSLFIGLGLLAVTSRGQAQPAAQSPTAQPADAPQIYLPAMNPEGGMPSLGGAFDNLKINGVSISLTSVADLQTMLEAVQAAPPTPLAALPKDGNGQISGSGFWSLQNPSWPPLPGDIFGVDAWPLGNGNLILNDRDVDYDELAAEAQTAAALEAALMPRTSMSRMPMSSLSSSYAYGNPVYLTNLMANLAYDGSTTATFSIGGGTNFVPYDILTTTNLLTPVASWDWLGIGYTSNNYTFTEQPGDVGFYMLAKPAKTMTVGFGKDSYGQCDVPLGLTNIVMVAGGQGHSLALRADGTLIAWGANDYGQTNVPANMTNVAMVSSGYGFNVALLTNGTVRAWGLNIFGQTSVPADLTNATVISAGNEHSLALRDDGTVEAWGYNSGWGETNVPPGLTNVTAISAGFGFSLAVSNGYVIAWGNNGYGQGNVPAGLSNAVDVAAGVFHSLALKADGTVAAWGRTNSEINVPAGLSNVVAIAAGGDYATGLGYSLALKKDGHVVARGGSPPANPVEGLDNVIGIAAGSDHALALRTGPPTPVITLEPVDQYQALGSNVTFTVKGQGLYGVTYQWQTNGVNLAGATNATLLLTNLTVAQQGTYGVIVTDLAGNGSLTSSNANLYIITPPVFIYQSTPTNIVTIYGKYVALSGMATAPGLTNGFPITYQWQLNGTNISATSTNYNFDNGDATAGDYTLTAHNAAGSASIGWQVSLTDAINVTNDLLLIYNTNSQDSLNVLNYYLAHRPGVSGANVLGVGWPGIFVTNYATTGDIIGITNGTVYETVSPADFTNWFLNPILNWMTANSKQPQYVVLMPDVPSRVNPDATTGANYPFYYPPHTLASFSYQLRTSIFSWSPYVTHLNMNDTNDCIGYINKLEFFGTNYSLGQVIISPSAGGYADINYVVDDIRHGAGWGIYEDYTLSGGIVSSTTNGLLSAGVPTDDILFYDGTETLSNGVVYNLPHPTNISNIAGYICWGAHSSLGKNYAINHAVQWAGNSSWWIIRTEESANGQRLENSQCNFLQWYSGGAFGGTNYSITPVGAVSYTDEPGAGGTDNSKYFGLWASGENFGICAWESRNTPNFQAVGDPFVKQ